LAHYAAVAEVPALRRCPPPDMLDHLGITAQHGGALHVESS
jgi:hypothetical protein